MKLRAFEYVLALEKYRNFRRAAQASNISPSALSRAVQTMEEDFGLKLFDRGRGGVFPTPAGQEFVRRARLLIQQADDLGVRMKSLGQAAAGEVALGITQTPEALYLSSFLTGMLCDAPQIKVHARTGTGAELALQLDDGKIEFLICSDPDLADLHKYQVETLLIFDLYVITRKEHPLSQLKRVSRNDLMDYSFVGCTFDEDNMWPPTRLPLVMHIVTNNYNTLFDAVASSDAYLMFPRIDRHGNIDEDRFAYTKFSEDVFSPQASFLLVRARQRSLSLAAEIAIAQFRALMKSDK